MSESPSQPIRYRPATAADATALGAAVWIDTCCEHGVPTDFAEYVLAEFTPANFAAAIADPTTVFRLAEAAEGPVGFIDLRLAACNQYVPVREGSRGS